MAIRPHLNKAHCYAGHDDSSGTCDKVDILVHSIRTWGQEHGAGLGPPRDRAVGVGGPQGQGLYQLEGDGEPASRNTGPRCRAEEAGRAGAHGRGGKGARTRFKTAVKSGDVRGTTPADERGLSGARVTWAAVPSMMGCRPHGWDTRTRGAGPPGSHPPHVCRVSLSLHPLREGFLDFHLSHPHRNVPSALPRAWSII